MLDYSNSNLFYHVYKQKDMEKRRLDFVNVGVDLDDGNMELGVGKRPVRKPARIDDDEEFEESTSVASQVSVFELYQYCNFKSS